ncbi:putative oxidoreductase linked to yggC [Alkalibacterium sp. AK22]|uniref:zinc-binding dehydrogenase n=1 Tax=Alkalibacterium sp. AK22 TaxID=1229520 RepID=UPI000451F4A5|nr:zinc-binding dehydrogenase [Alkalibacterium sp. AK22]EXJ23607.1 putative oxidoreductase linked to yggC [Alkalibacterium sp. AK22]
MKTKAVALYGKKDLRVREFDLPEIGEEELLVEVVSDTACLSTLKATLLAEEHKRVPDNLMEHPVMIGHEFGGYIRKVGKKIQDQFTEGDKFVLQPAMGLESGYSAGYSYEYFGGNATYCIIPKVAIDLGCVLPYNKNYFANGSLAEPMSTIIGAFNANYHTRPYVYTHEMGVKKGGQLALLGCGGPMGIGALDYAVNGDLGIQRIVATEIDEGRLNRLKKLIPPEVAKDKGIDLVYVDASKSDDQIKDLMTLSEGKGFDDVFVFAAVEPLLVLGDSILGNDGCLNFFAGPTDKQFKVPVNLYNVHYASTHFVGTSGGSTDDMRKSLELTEEGKINPSIMITHVGGLESVPDMILGMQDSLAGKNAIYPGVSLELTALEEFREKGKEDKRCKELYSLIKKHDGIWNEEAEQYLLTHFTD